MCPLGYSTLWTDLILFVNGKKNKNLVIFNMENQLLEYDFGTFCTQLKLSAKLEKNHRKTYIKLDHKVFKASRN